MTKIIDQLMQEAGLNNEQATKSITVMTNYLKAKFPRALHDEIETIMKDGDFGDAFKSNFKEVSGKAEETAKEFANKAEEVLTEAGEKLRGWFKGKQG